MANTQEIVWTLLPNGNGANGKFKASILVSPRLASTDPAGTVLSQYSGWKNWPARLKDLSFTVNGEVGPVATIVSQPDPDVWSRLFSDKTPVTPWTFQNMAGKTVLSYPVAALEKTLDALYGDMAVTAGGALPARTTHREALRHFRERTDPRDVLKKLRAAGANAGEFGRTLPKPKPTAGSGPMAAPPELAATLDLLTAYHRPLNAQTEERWKPRSGDTREAFYYRKAERPALPDPKSYVKSIDFHQIVAALGQYPDLARLCGLIIDVEIEKAMMPLSDGLWVWPHWKTGGQGKAITPTSQTSRENGRFIMRPTAGNTTYIDRFLRLRGGPFEVVQMDVDGGGLKFSQFAESMQRDVDVDYDDDTQSNKDKPAEAGAPSLRTAGLMLAWKRRDQALGKAFNRSAEINGQAAATPDKTAGPPVFADDVIRGYRVDIGEGDETNPGPWRTLCARHGQYAFSNVVGAPSLPYGSSKPPSAGGDMQEGMARLAAGSSSDGANPDIIKVHEGLFGWRGWSLVAPEPGLFVDKDNSFRSEADDAPKGLPLEVTSLAQPGTLPSLRFGRKYRMRVRLVDLAGNSEPFAPKSGQPNAAESVAVTFLRYEPVEPPVVALVRRGGGVEAPADGESMGRIAIRTMDAKPAGLARRHLAPPRVSVRFAEMHGMLDKGGIIDPGWYAALKDQDAALDTAKVETPLQGGGMETTEYAVGDETLVLPYLPDPLAIGVALRIEGVEGLDAQTVHQAFFYGGGTANLPHDWPTAKPLRIELTSGPASVSIAGRVVKLTLRHADKAKVRISCIVPKAGLPLMKLNALMSQRSPAAALPALKAMVEDAGHWMMTPWRTLEFVHAVQRPLIKPSVATQERYAHRVVGDRTANLGFQTPLSAKSTGRVDLRARWHEPSDDAPEGPIDRLVKDDPWNQTIARDQAPGNKMFVRAPHTFPDTRYRRVTYWLEATTRYREFMPPAIRNTPADLIVPSAEKTVWIPNAAAPPPPKVLYVIPTFGWTRVNSGSEKRSWRSGGGLRVYLDRPWYASGYGEMLAVVLAQPGTSQTVLDGPLKMIASQWGRDPIWPGDPIKSVAPALGAFPLAHYDGSIPIAPANLPDEEGNLPPGPFAQKLGTAGGAALPGGQLVNVAPHAVAWDADRGLWYADIVIDAPRGSYFPFIRLGLARYHPISEVGAHLSDVVLGEFAQLTPDRLAVVSKAQLGFVKVAVYGALPNDPTAPQTPFAGQIDISLQTLRAGGDPDLDWQDAPKPNKSFAPFPTIEGVGDGGSALSLQQFTVSQSPAALAGLRSQADGLVAKGRFREVLADARLLSVMAPPLIYEETVGLVSPPNGGKLRLLITESETYQAGPGRSADWATRIVYAETIEL